MMQRSLNMPTEFEVLRTLVDLQLELTASEQWNAASLVAQKIKNAMEPLESRINYIQMNTPPMGLISSTPVLQPPFEVTCIGNGMTTPGADVVHTMPSNPVSLPYVERRAAKKSKE